MKLELRLSGKVITVEAEGIISVQITEDSSVVEPGIAVEGLEGSLFSRLVEVRKELSREQKVPPYIIFHDKTLKEMAEKMPATLEELGQIAGVGQAKLEKYGERFLEVINVPG
jgi:ATP-dependent DNA helicase RecQ